jgi:serine/threonine protein kinase
MEDNSKPDDIIIGGAVLKHEKLLSVGAVGALWEAVLSDKRVAVKIAVEEKTEKNKQRVMEEAKMLHMSSHPNIIGFIGFDVDSLSIVMEHGGMDLRTYLNNHNKQYDDSGLDLLTIRIIARSIALAGNYLHKCGILHRDIKTSNILIDGNMNVRLADFDTAVLGITASGYNVGTTQYMAPEILLGCTYTQSADVYSFAQVVAGLYCESYLIDVDADSHRKMTFQLEEWIYGGLDEVIESLDINKDDDEYEDILTDETTSTYISSSATYDEVYNGIIFSWVLMGPPPDELLSSMQYYIVGDELKYHNAHGNIPTLGILKVIDSLVGEGEAGAHAFVADFLSLSLRYNNRATFEQLLSHPFLSNL